MVDNAVNASRGRHLISFRIQFRMVRSFRQRNTCFPGFIIKLNSILLLVSLFQIIAKLSIAILKYRLIDTISKVTLVAAYADIALSCQLFHYN